MEWNGKSLLSAALGLPETDRALIAEGLLATLAAETEPPSDDELAAELDRRFNEALHDPAATIAWADLKDE
jgi:putative addiction module component (TIGR02574 family)